MDVESRNIELKGVSDFEFAPSTLSRLAKQILSQCSKDPSSPKESQEITMQDDHDEHDMSRVRLSRDVLQMLNRATLLFVLHCWDAAVEKTHMSKRGTVSSSDVAYALESHKSFDENILNQLLTAYNVKKH